MRDRWSIPECTRRAPNRRPRGCPSSVCLPCVKRLGPENRDDPDPKSAAAALGPMSLSTTLDQRDWLASALSMKRAKAEPGDETAARAGDAKKSKVNLESSASSESSSSSSSSTAERPKITLEFFRNASMRLESIVNPRRTRTLKAAAQGASPGAGPVVYWMSRDQRVQVRGRSLCTCGCSFCDFFFFFQLCIFYFFFIPICVASMCPIRIHWRP